MRMMRSSNFPTKNTEVSEQSGPVTQTRRHFDLLSKTCKSTILKVRLVSGSLSRSQHHPIDQEQTITGNEALR